MFAQQASGLIVAVVDDTQDFIINRAGSMIAEGFGSIGTTLVPEIGIDFRGELDHAEAVAHAPSCDHSAGKIRSLLDIVFRSGCPAAEDNFFGRPSTENSDDARAKIFFRIIIAITLRPLIRDAERLSTRHDRYTVNRIGTRHQQPQDSVAALMVSNAFALCRT